MRSFLRPFAALLAVAAVAASAAPARAAIVVTFDGAPAGGFLGVNPYVESGVRFQSSGQFFLIDPAFPGPGIAAPSDYGFFQNGNLTINLVSGGPFDLLSFSAAQTFGAPPGTLTVTGTRAGGGTVQTNLSTLTGTFTNFTLTGFTNLTSVTIVTTSNFTAIDNVTVDVVPEPASLALLGAGGLGLAAARLWRRQGTAKVTAAQKLSQSAGGSGFFSTTRRM